MMKFVEFFKKFKPPQNKNKEFKAKIKIDSSGASTWVNMLDYFISDEGKNHLKSLSDFAKMNRQ